MDKDTIMLALMICLNKNPDNHEPCAGCPLETEPLCIFKLLNEVAKNLYASRDIKFLMPEKE